MSLPIAATGPPNVEMKPILTVFCCAKVGAGALRRARQPRSRAIGCVSLESCLPDETLIGSLAAGPSARNL